MSSEPASGEATVWIQGCLVPKAFSTSHMKRGRVTELVFAKPKICPPGMTSTSVVMRATRQSASVWDDARAQSWEGEGVSFPGDQAEAYKMLLFPASCGKEDPLFSPVSIIC